MRSKGESYDYVLAETINGLYEAALIHRRAPWRTKEAVEFDSPGDGMVRPPLPLLLTCGRHPVKPG